MTAALRARYGFVCDDVRQEANGKLMFIGTYNGNIVVPTFPAQFSVRLVTFLENNGPGAYEVDVGVFHDGKQIAGASGQLQALRKGGSLTPVPVVMEVQNEGMLEFKFRHSGKRWQTVIALPILTNASAQLS